MNFTFNEMKSSNNTTIQLIDLSFDVWKAIEVLVNCVLAEVLGVFGILGNVLNIIVLTQHDMRNTTNLILTFLSVSDLIFSVLTVFYHIKNIVFFLNIYLSYSLNSYYYQFFDGIKLLFLFTSTYFVTMLSVERMIAVCFPFHVARIVTTFRIKCAAIVILFLLAGLLTPLFCITYLDIAIVDNITFTQRSVTSFFVNNYAFLMYFYFSTLTNIYSMVIPIIIVLMCNIATVIKLNSSSEKRKDLSINTNSKRIKDLRSIKISFFLSTALILFVLVPSGIIETLIGQKIIADDLSLRTVTLIIDSENLLYIVNSSFNFVLYVITSPKFAQTFKNLFNYKTKI
uniref:G-protein coupled receptors family 1 profile domain-containing protein n=1 Tax=Biomphalaria glabrata TaxID=6526 RepID=A0A2C9KYK8_BIOGL